MCVLAFMCVAGNSVVDDNLSHFFSKDFDGVLRHYRKSTPEMLYLTPGMYITSEIRGRTQTHVIVVYISTPHQSGLTRLANLPQALV